MCQKLDIPASETQDFFEHKQKLQGKTQKHLFFMYLTKRCKGFYRFFRLPSCRFQSSISPSLILCKSRTSYHKAANILLIWRFFHSQSTMLYAKSSSFLIDSDTCVHDKISHSSSTPSKHLSRSGFVSFLSSLTTYSLSIFLLGCDRSFTSLGSFVKSNSP